jgi:hypothetical protein
MESVKGGEIMQNRFLCFGIRRAGVTTIAYVENGRVIIKALPITPKQPPRLLPERVAHHA